jgi:hypothetical protein
MISIIDSQDQIVVVEVLQEIKKESIKRKDLKVIFQLRTL